MLQTSKFSEYVVSLLDNRANLMGILKYKADDYTNTLRDKGSSDIDWKRFLDSTQDQLTAAFDATYTFVKRQYEYYNLTYPYEVYHPFLFVFDESNNQQEDVTTDNQKLQADFSFDVYEFYNLENEFNITDPDNKDTCTLKVVHTFEGSIYYQNGEVTQESARHISTKNIYVYE